MSQLHLVSDDLIKIATAVWNGRAIGGMRVIGQIKFFIVGVTTFTMTGNGWTIYVNLKTTRYGTVYESKVFGVNLIGDRERFEEDFILGKMTVG